MSEKFGALWIDFDDDYGTVIVFEFYDRDSERLFIIYRRQDKLLMPYAYIKKESMQFSLPL